MKYIVLLPVVQLKFTLKFTVVLPYYGLKFVALVTARSILETPQ